MAGAVNGVAGKDRTPRAPRRVVLLAGDETSDVERTLVEYERATATGRRVHEDVQRLADEHHGRTVAAEWQGPLGWTRFVWCRRAETD